MNSAAVVQNSDGLDDLARDALTANAESAREYLRQWWLSGAIETLRQSRRASGLTQQQLADQLGIDQTSITRFERDDEGRSSLSRYIDYALACGVVPFDVQVIPFDCMRNFALHAPSGERTATAYAQLAQQVALAPVTDYAFQGHPSYAPMVSLAPTTATGDASPDVAGQRPLGRAQGAPLTSGVDAVTSVGVVAAGLARGA